MSPLLRRLALRLATALLLAGCGWFAKTRLPPTVSLSDEIRSRGHQEVPEPVLARAEASTSPYLPTPDRGEVVDRVVAVVNKDVITLSELLETAAHYFYERQQPIPREPDRGFLEQLLARLIETRLELQEAEREKMVVEDAEVAEQLAELLKRSNFKSEEELERALSAQGLTLESVRKRLREQIMIQMVIRRKVTFRVSVTDDEIERYFIENREKLEKGFSFRARHILITPEPPGSEPEWEAARRKAEEVWDLVRSGQDFAELARKFSQDPSAAEGGDLGVMKQGELDPGIEAAVLRLRPGDAAGPVRSRLGYHIVKLEWKESMSGEALTQTKRQIREILFRQKYQARLEGWLKEIKQRAVIEIRL